MNKSICLECLTSLSVRLTFRFFKLQLQPQFQSQTVTLAAFRGQRHGLRLKLGLKLKFKSVKTFAVLINLSNVYLFNTLYIRCLTNIR